MARHSEWKKYTSSPSALAKSTRCKSDRHNRIGDCFRKCKHGASRRGIPFTITKQEYATSWRDDCAMCGDEFEQRMGNHPHYNHLKARSLDRIIATKGYVSGNIQQICYHCNLKKGNGEVKWPSRATGKVEKEVECVL